MSRNSIDLGNILNRSPWVVQTRQHPERNRRFSYGRKGDAEIYLNRLLREGVKAKLIQLQTSFQLRVRRKGLRDQFITFDSEDEARKALLKFEAELSVSIVRDYAAAARVTLRELMVRYRDEVVPGHKGAAIERNRIDRILRDEDFVDKPLAALNTEDLQDFISERLEDVAPATVDRDLDVLSQVLRYADDVWKVAPVESPFKGLRAEPDDGHALPLHRAAVPVPAGALLLQGAVLLADARQVPAGRSYRVPG